jgi:predicted transcriptional regulator
MRDHISELRQIGFSLKAIAKQSGLTEKTLLKPVKSSTKAYEAIRNTNRRLARQYLVQHGVPSKQADVLRRTALNPDAKPIVRNTVQHIKSKKTQKINQYYIYGKFQHTKTKEIRFEYGFSQAKRSQKLKVTKSLIAACVRHARAKLGGTNWRLVNILEQGWTSYELTDT